MANAFVINGMGHCGTRLVHGFASRLYPPLKDVMFLENMSDLESFDIHRNCTFKTHSPFPYNNHSKPLKVVYLFGDIFNIILSFDLIETPDSGESGKLAKNAGRFLHVDQSYNFWDVDTFQYKRHFNNWNTTHKYPVLIVKYETLYNNIDKVLDFLETPKHQRRTFPKYKARKTNWETASSEVKEKLIRVYGNARDYINNQPEIIEVPISK